MDLDKLNKLTLDDIAENPELYLGDQIKEVEGWLSENVRVFDEPNTVTLSQFDIDWHRFSGSFCLSLDETVIEERIIGGNTRLFWQSSLKCFNVFAK